jgi:hypothetical protein
MKRLTYLIATPAVTADAHGFDTPLTPTGAAAFRHEWRQWSADLAVEEEGCFALRYLGEPATLGDIGDIGLDTVRAVTAVPEPAGLLVLASSLGVIGLMRRREHH